MEHDEVKIQLFNQVELHLGELGIVGREGRHSHFYPKEPDPLSAKGSKRKAGGTERTRKDDPRFLQCTLDMHWCLLRFRSDVASRGSDEGGVRFTVRVAKVEPPEEDRRGRYYLLPELKPLADLLYYWR